MRYRLIPPVLALGFLLAASASGQHHHAVSGKVEYDPEPGGGDTNPPSGCAGVQAKITISANGTTFSPATVTVDAGQPVCWTWTTSTTHNVRADDGSFTSGPPADRGTFQRTFSTPGTFSYHCQVHGTPTGGMRGTVVVRGNSGGGGDDNGPGKLELASSSYTVSESARTLIVTVQRTGGSEGAASVKIGAVAGTAKKGKDFVPRNAVLRWANGDRNPKTFQVTIKNDKVQEQNETFSIRLTKATRATIGTSSALVTIEDDDTRANRRALAAPTEVRAAGQSESEVRLTWTADSAASGFRIERRKEGGAFEEIAAVPAEARSFTDSGLPGDALFQYRVRAEGIDGFSAYSAIAAGATDGLPGPCDEGRALCLKDGRFEATVRWRASEEDDVEREAKGVLLPETAGSGFFSLGTDGDEPQLLLKIHDGCAVNDHYWLDFAAVTDVELLVRVRDTLTGRTWVYYNPGGSVPASVRDVDAFATCP
jgi:plastocyanin